MSQISVRPSKEEAPVEFEVDIPEVDEENPQAFIDWAKESLRDEDEDEDAGLLTLVLNARQSMVVGAQSYARTRYKKFKEEEISEEEMRASIAEWKPTGRRPAKSSVDKGVELFDSMSEDERAAFLAKLRQSSEAEG